MKAMHAMLAMAFFSVGVAHAEIPILKTGPDAMYKEYQQRIQAQQSQLNQPVGADTQQYLMMVAPQMFQQKQPATIKDVLDIMIKARAVSGSPVDSPMATPGGGMATPRVAPTGGVK